MIFTYLCAVEYFLSCKLILKLIPHYYLQTSLQNEVITTIVFAFEVLRKSQEHQGWKQGVESQTQAALENVIIQSWRELDKLRTQVAKDNNLNLNERTSQQTVITKHMEILIGLKKQLVATVWVTDEESAKPAASKDAQGRIVTLPSDLVVFHIFRNLKLPDLGRVASVSHRWETLSNFESIYGYVWARDFEEKYSSWKHPEETYRAAAIRVLKKEETPTPMGLHFCVLCQTFFWTKANTVNHFVKRHKVVPVDENNVIQMILAWKPHSSFQGSI